MKPNTAAAAPVRHWSPAIDSTSRLARRPRILMVSANAYPVMGGTETHIHEVAPRIVRAGFNVTVLTTDRSGRLPMTETADGVQIRRVRAWPETRDYYIAPGLYPTIVGGQWDLMHCQGYHTLAPVIAMLAGVRARLPYVLTFHSGGHDSRARNWSRFIQHRAVRPFLVRARRLIAVSNWEKERFRQQLRIPASRFVTIPNGAAIAKPPAADTPKDDSLILSVGRLERYKGHQRVIAAMPHVLGSLPAARLRIVGSGPYEPELRSLLRGLGLEAKVEIRALDPRDRGGMATLMASSGLVALLSEYESQGIAVMEALALRQRVLVADTTALGELARAGWARAIPLDSPPRQVATAIVEQLRSDPPGVLALPTWDDCADQLVDLYRTVLVRTHEH